MSRIVWDRAGEHFYETGVDRGVLYPTVSGAYSKGVVWNGLTSVSENPSGADTSAQYADNIKYLNLVAAEEFGATIEAFTYPDEFAVCDGSAEPVRGVRIGQQTRRPFGFTYRTLVGNDLEGTEYGYQIHIVYGATASPSSRDYNTVNDSPEAITFSWEVTTTPVEVTGYKPTATLVIDSNKVSLAALNALEDILYGSAETEPRLPMPDEVFAIINDNSAITLTVTSPSGEVFDKSVEDLQERITVEDGKITGVLKYVADFTGFSDKSYEQVGNFLALDVQTNVGSADITVELLGGTAPVCKKDKKGVWVMRVTNPKSQSVRISAIEGRDSKTDIYSLSELEVKDATSIIAASANNPMPLG